MIPENQFYLPKYFSSKAIAAFFIAIAACNLLFYKKMLPFGWMVSATIEAVCFFYFTQRLSRRWLWYSPKRFEKKLFYTTLVLRVIWVVTAYFFYIWMRGEPFEFAAADSHFYESAAGEFAGYIQSGNWAAIAHEKFDVSDMGYPFWLALLHLIFGNSLLAPRLVHTVFSALTAVLIYRLASRNFGEAAGRLAGIMCMLLPNFFFYAGIHLKETVMIFLIVAYAYNADMLLRNAKLSWINLVLTVLGGLVLFFFRTALGIVAFFALFTALIFTRGQQMKKWGKRIVIAFWVLICLAILISNRIIGEVETLYRYRNTNQQTGMHYRSIEQGGNSFARYGSMAVFAPMMFTIPFPSFTQANEEQQNQMMFSGGYFVKNIFAFFVILALIILVRNHQWREHLFILAFFISYLLVVAKSNFAVAERFHLPAMPFFLMLAAFGITRINKKEKKWYLPYIVFIVMVVIGWNWFKLAGRGLA